MRIKRKIENGPEGNCHDSGSRRLVSLFSSFFFLFPDRKEMTDGRSLDSRRRDPSEQLHRSCCFHLAYPEQQRWQQHPSISICLRYKSSDSCLFNEMSTCLSHLADSATDVRHTKTHTTYHSPPHHSDPLSASNNNRPTRFLCRENPPTS